MGGGLGITKLTIFNLYKEEYLISKKDRGKKSAAHTGCSVNRCTNGKNVGYAS